jgi:D-glycero-alpha-D-manno-heptose 1-phosphate guanylyltransferase
VSFPSEALVLAGGLGTRLRTVVSDVPKPMAPVLERPFLEYLLEYWIGQGISHFILSVGYKHEVIQSHFGTRYRSARLSYSIESQALGTGGACRLAMQSSEGSHADVWVLNGDTLFAVSAHAMYADHVARCADITVACFSARSTPGRYASVLSDGLGRISSLGVSINHAPEALFNGGAYLMCRDRFQGVGRHFGNTPCSLENDLIPVALASGIRIFSHFADSPFLDIGIPADYERAPAFVEQL